MRNEKIHDIVEQLKKRAEGREEAIAATRKDGAPTDAELAAATVHQAHIDEIEYAIDELQQALQEDQDADDQEAEEDED